MGYIAVAAIGSSLFLCPPPLLRRDGPRLKWIGDALVRAVEVGGLDLFRDLFLPLLVNEKWLDDNAFNGALTPDNNGRRIDHAARSRG